MTLYVHIIGHVAPDLPINDIFEKAQRSLSIFKNYVDLNSEIFAKAMTVWCYIKFTRTRWMYIKNSIGNDRRNIKWSEG